MPPIQLAPFETRSIDLMAVLAYVGFNDSSNTVNLAFSFAGRAGDVILAAGSANQAGDWTLTSEPQRITARGKRTAFWNSNGAIDTVLWLWNPSDQPEELAIRLEAAAGKGKYRHVIQLAAGESKAVSIGRLLAGGLPDREGNLPPADAIHGILALETSSGGLAPTNVLMASTALGGSVSPLDTCYNPIYCCGMSGCGPVPGSFTINVGDTFQLQTHGYDCNGWESFMTSMSDWSSTDGGIATVNNSTNKGLVTGLAAGNVTINAHLPLMQPFTGTICSDPYHTAECPALVAPIVYATGAVKPKITGISPSDVMVGNQVDVRITGSGFGSNPSINISGSGVSASIRSANNTEINANFTIASGASGGIRQVSVTATSQESNWVGLYVQIPSRIVFLDWPGAPGGQQPIQICDPSGNVYRLNSTIAYYSQCGVYKNLVYDLVDDRGLPIKGTYQFWETFKNYQGPVGTPSDQHIDMTPRDVLTDLQYFGKDAPACLGPNDFEVFDQNFYVLAAGIRYSLSTQIHITRGKQNSIYVLDVQMTIP